MALINSKNISRIAKRRDNGGYGIGERKTFYITYFEYDISDESGQIRGALRLIDMTAVWTAPSPWIFFRRNFLYRERAT